MTEPSVQPPDAIPETTPTSSDRWSIRRIWVFSLVAYVAFAGWFIYHSDEHSLLGLTCSAAVVMINFLWLEEIAMRLLGPAPQIKPWTFGARALARYALLGVAAAVFVVRFNFLSVLMGMSVLVIGVIGEALYALINAPRAENR